MLNIPQDPIVTEAKALSAGNTSSVPNLMQLSQAFIAKRLSNSTEMESAKQKALKILLEKLEADPDGLTPAKLVSLIELMGEQTAGDFKALIDLQVAQTGGKGGKGAAAGSAVPGMFGFTPEAPVSDRPQPIKREMYKLLDSLNQVAEAVVKDKSGVQDERGV